MKSWRWVAAGVTVLAAVWLSSRAATPAEEERPPARVERVEGTTLKRIILTPKAASRLGIQTAVAEGNTVAYSALIYDATGSTWVYTSPQELVFLRHRVTVESIAKDRVIVTAGPAEGTKIVTIGAAELYGVEAGLV